MDTTFGATFTQDTWLPGDPRFPGPPLCAPVSLLQPARLALWQGARERGETGVEAAEGWAGLSLWEVPAVPDFSAARFPDLSGLDAAQRVQRVGALQAQLLAGLYPLGDRTAVSLRYAFERPPGQDGHIRLFLVLRVFGRTEAEAAAGLSRAREALERGFPREYPLVEHPAPDRDLVAAVLSPHWPGALAEVLKPEQVVAAWHDPALCGFPFWYHPLPFQPAEHDMTGVCRALMEGPSSGPILVDLTLQPALPLTETERAEVTTWGTLAERWGRDQRLQRPGGLYSKPQAVEIAADPHAPEARKAYADLLARYGTPQGRPFLYAVRVLAPDAGTATSVANALAARALAPGGSHQLVTLTSGHPGWERAMNAVRLAYVTPAVCNEPLWQHPSAPETLRRLHRMADLKEVGGFFRLPIPGRDGCPGVPLDGGLPATAAARKTVPGGLTLGRFLDGGRVSAEEASVPLPDLAKHALIVGTPGSGKTTLCFSLLAQLWREHRIPFLVLEPAKTEYRALLEVPGLKEDLLVFTVGSERAAPFRFNPLEVPGGVAVSEHISTLNTCFSGAFSLHDPLPMLLDEALREAYADCGWSEYGLGGEDPNLPSPTLADLQATALRVAARSRYRGELAGNIQAALETRLGSLVRGPKGRCFNTRRSLPPDLLLTRPVVLELEGLSDEEKALTIMFLLAAVRAHARTQRRSGAPLSHVTLVEEAHAVLGRGDGQGTTERANPQAVSIRFFTRMLAEMRALGEGLVVADQLPMALAPEVLKLTGLKVMHRVVSAEDRRELGQAMVLDAGQLEQAATLPPGHSLVFGEGWARSRLVQEPDFKGRHGMDVPPDETTLRERMAPFLARDPVRDVYLPYTDCGHLCRRCDPRIREQSERWAEKKLPLIRAQIARRPGRRPETIALEEYMHGLDLPADQTVRWLCAHVHLTERVLPALAGPITGEVE